MALIAQLVRALTPRIAATLAISLLGPALVFHTLVVLSDARLTFLLYHGLFCLGVPAADLLLWRRLSPRAAAVELGLAARRAAGSGSGSVERGGRRGVGGAAAEWRLGLLLGTAFFVAIVGFFALAGGSLLDPAAVRDLLRAWRLDGLGLPMLLAMLILANAVVEEVFWRGYLLARWRRAGAGTGAESAPLPAAGSGAGSGAAAWGAIVAAALGYASYHAVTTAALFSPLLAVPLTAVVLAAGIFWGWLRLRRGSLVAPVVSHLLADAALMAVYVTII